MCEGFIIISGVGRGGEALCKNKFAELGCVWEGGSAVLN